MPRLSQIIIRTALLWLALGYTFGGLVLFTKGVPLLPWLWALRGAHIHMLLVGWTIQLTCGVAYWILPRLDVSGSRGDVRLVWACYVVLNSGVTLAALQSIAVGLGLALRWPLLLIGGCYLGAAVLFVCHAWPRVRPFQTFLVGRA